MLQSLTTAACALVLMMAGQAADPILKRDATFGDWRDDKPGVKRLLTLPDLPPVSTPTYAAAVIAPISAGADSMFNAVRVYRIPAGTAKPARSEIYADGLRERRGTEERFIVRH